MLENPLIEKRSTKKPFILLGAVIAIGLGFLVVNLGKPKTTEKHEVEKTEVVQQDKHSVPLVLDASTFKLIDPLIDYSLASVIRPSTNIVFIKTLTPPINTASSESPIILLPSQLKVEKITVGKGESLSILFNKVGLSAATLHKVINCSPEAKKSLEQLRIGQPFEFTLDDQGELVSLVSKPSMLDTYTVVKKGDSYRFKHTAISPTYKEVYAYGVIESSLFNAADKAGVPHKMIIEIANAFGYDIDFALDLREGDEFEAIFEQKLVKGKVVGTGRLLAARFVNRGKEYTAVRYENEHRVAAYYRADGSSMRRAFIRTPVDFTRISSRFNPGRYHPVLNKIRAHKGVDYAAPTGTSIRATGNGRIIELGVKGGYGNAIVIQHGKSYTTLYGHMSRFAPNLKVGSQVKQGQTIGYVGMTGLATGPHLHYEFRVNGKHVDPLSVKLPMADPLSGKEKASFLHVSQPLMNRMQQERNVLLAKKEAL